MHFTREPIIETVISARDGHKLTLQSSKIPGSEELVVEAVEVISFGQALFFRSLERTKHFLLPVQDYHLFETKEVRMVLKAATIERTPVKIGGGKGKEGEEKAPDERKPREKRSRGEPREPKERDSKEREPKEQEPVDLQEEESALDREEALAGEGGEKKKERRRNRKRKGREPREEGSPPTSEVVEGSVEASSPSFILPPPTTLISETLAHYRTQQEFRSAFIDSELSSVTELEPLPTPEAENEGE